METRFSGSRYNAALLPKAHAPDVIGQCFMRGEEAIFMFRAQVCQQGATTGGKRIGKESRTAVAPGPTDYLFEKRSPSRNHTRSGTRQLGKP